MRIWLVAYNYWVYKGCFDVINVSVNRVSTILSHTDSAINGLHCLIGPKWMYKSVLLRKKQMTRSLPHPKNEHHQSVNNVWHCIMKHPVGCAGTVSHNRTIGRLSLQQWWKQHFYYILKMNVNRASMTFGLASWNMHGLCSNVTPKLRYRPPSSAKTLATTSLLYAKNERQQSVKDF